MRLNWPGPSAAATAIPSHLLRVESLESRRMLTLASDFELPDEPDSADPDSAEYGGALSDEFLDLINKELQEAANDPDAVDPTVEPLPVVPFDDEVDPVFGCPGVDSEFCLPGDMNDDGQVEFDDFLNFSQNFGMQDATWADGDFDGDGEVGFNDFLLLASNFG